MFTVGRLGPLAAASGAAWLASGGPFSRSEEEKHTVGGVFHVDRSQAAKIHGALDRGARWYHDLCDDKRDEYLRAEVPLSKRYVGTKIERSPRAKLCLSDNEVVHTSHLINDLVDLVWFDEAQEQEIFEFCVLKIIDTIAHNLPNEFIRLVHSKQVMPKVAADKFEAAMSRWLFAEVQLPFLDDADRRRVIRCVMAMLMRSMRRSHEDVAAHLSPDEQQKSPDEHHALVTDVFLRGVQHIFYDEDERNAFVNNLAAYTDKLPLVPVSVVASMIENAVNMASASVTNALTTSYHEYGDAVRGRRHHELAVRRHPLEDPHTESQRKKAHEKPFEHVLRYNMCLELMDPKEDIFGRLQLVMPESMPVSMRFALVRLFVEELIQTIEAEKIEAIFSRCAANVDFECAQATVVAAEAPPRPWWRFWRRS
ncbi:ABC transporter [Aureococcus anophagefferens]|uniref:ABC transporter n=1 Tax=Aureococcus anophagefferens TaxID=44056 RepID=A0ABR1GBY8_AURAN